MRNSNVEIHFKPQGDNLLPYSPCFLCSSSNFAFQIFKQIPQSEDYILVYRSETQETDHPKFESLRMKLGKFCSNDPNIKIKIGIYVD